jgi:hypothetical protein
VHGFIEVSWSAFHAFLFIFLSRTRCFLISFPQENWIRIGKGGNCVLNCKIVIILTLMVWSHWEWEHFVTFKFVTTLFTLEFGLVDSRKWLLFWRSILCWHHPSNTIHISHICASAGPQGMTLEMGQWYIIIFLNRKDISTGTPQLLHVAHCHLVKMCNVSGFPYVRVTVELLLLFFYCH